MLIPTGDFSASFEPKDIRSESIAHLSGQWSTGVFVRMENPFYVEPFRLAENDPTTEGKRGGPHVFALIFSGPPI
jgi:hypothetical protein